MKKYSPDKPNEISIILLNFQSSNWYFYLQFSMPRKFAPQIVISTPEFSNVYFQRFMGNCYIEGHSSNASTRNVSIRTWKIIFSKMQKFHKGARLLLSARRVVRSFTWCRRAESSLSVLYLPIGEGAVVSRRTRFKSRGRMRARARYTIGIWFK